MSVLSFSSPAQGRAETARANAKRFALAIDDETNDAMKAYLRHLAVSWTRIAEQYEFVDAFETERADSA